MKAVIMAGGKGTRLRPLTCHLPKPMVSLLDRPCMEYIIDLLKKHGITEIAVTVQYLPQVIKNHFGDGSDYGVKLHYFEETSPLGTAGSVKNAEDFLDDTFLVISGDGLTDFDLSAAIAYHKAKQALGTLVLTQVEVPLEYGVVMTQEDGQIIRFLEKPSWSEVFSDTVNTGIYVLEPEILQFFERDREFDFSKDLFPLVMNQGLPLYGYVADGYWSDIGNLKQYRQTQFDMLDGLVDVQIRGFELSPQVWVGEGVTLHEGVQVTGPAFFGEGTTLERGAKVGPYAVTGHFNYIEQGTDVERTVLWNRNHIGRSVSLAGATLCSGVRVGAGASVGEDAVIGEKSVIGNMAVIKPTVKIWPEKQVGASTIQQTSLIWGQSASSSLFNHEGISGIPNLELTPEMVGKMAAAYGSCLRRGSTVSVSCDEFPYNGILKYAVISSLLANGIHVQDVGMTLAPIARHEVRRSECVGGVHLRRTGVETEEEVVMQFFDRQGLPIDKGMERKIENAFYQEDFARPSTGSIGTMHVVQPIVEHYLETLLDKVDVQAIRQRKLKVVVHCTSPQVMAVMHRLLERMGCSVLAVSHSGGLLLENIVKTNACDIGIQLDNSGQHFLLFTEQGYLLSEEEVVVLQALVSLNEQQPVTVPVTAPSVVENLMEQAGVSVIRTKTAPRSLLETSISSLQVHYDGFASMALLLNHLAEKRAPLHQIVESLPQFHMSTDFVSCPIEAKGRVMRRLLEEMKGHQLELIDGIKVIMEDGWALVLPDSEKALFKIVTQGFSAKRANELKDLYKTKIAAYQRG